MKRFLTVFIAIVIAISLILVSAGVVSADYLCRVKPPADKVIGYDDQPSWNGLEIAAGYTSALHIEPYVK